MDYETAKAHLINSLIKEAKTDEGDDAAKNIEAASVIVSVALDALIEIGKWTKRQNANS